MDKNYRKKIGKHCQNFRKSINMTQKTFAEVTGLTLAQVYHFEQGNTSNMEILLKYLNLGMDLDYDYSNYNNIKEE